MSSRPSQQPASLLRSRRPGTAAAKVVVAIVVLLVVSFGSAPAAMAETKVSVTSPSGDLNVEGNPIYLIVTVTPDQAIDGTITVTSDFGIVVATQEFDAAGGSTKEIFVRAPYVDNGLDVRVRTSDGGDKNIRSGFRTSSSDQAVGLSPGLVSDSNPRTVKMTGGNRSAALKPFDSSWLDYGPEVLGHHNALAMAEADFEALSETQRQNLFFWVTRGGHLVIDSPVDSPPAGIPVSFDGASKVALGVGNVSLSSGGISAGDFEGLFTARRIGSGNNFSGNSPSTGISELVSDAVLPTVPMGLLAPIMGVYVLAIGPGVWLWLRRRKGLPKVWIVVPAVALLSTVGIWGAGLILRGASSGAHVTLVSDYAGMSETRSQYIVSTGAGGFTGIQLKDGWEQDSIFGQGYDPYSGNPQRDAIRREDQLGRNLTPGGSTVAGATRIGASDPSWQIEVTRSGELLTGTVTNLTSYRLEDVVIAIASDTAPVATIDQGETVEFEITVGTGAGNVHSRVQNVASANSGEGESSSPGIYARWSSSIPGSQRDHIVVIGWTTETPGPLVSTSGDLFETGRTGFVSMSKLPPEALVDSPNGTLTLTDQRWSDERGVIDGANRVYPDMIGSYQYEFTGEPSSKPLAIDFDSTVLAADFWDGVKWVPSGLADASSGRGGSVGISPEFVVDGLITFRIGFIPDGFNDFDESVDMPPPVIRFADPDEELIMVEVQD